MKRILLVDDNQTIQRLVSLTFVGEGIEVLAASRGDAALEQLSRDEVDLVLADASAPGINGYDLCAAIKQNDALKGLPVILLLGASEALDHDRIARAGADATIAKPLDPSTLVELVQSSLSPRTMATAAGRHVQEDFTSFLLDGKSARADAPPPAPSTPAVDSRVSFPPLPQISPDLTAGPLSHVALAPPHHASESVASSEVRIEWDDDEKDLEEIVPIAVFSVPTSGVTDSSAAREGAATLRARADGSAILPHMTSDDIPGLRNLELPKAHTIEQKRAERVGGKADERYSMMLNELVNQIVSRVIVQIEPDLKQLVRDSLREIAQEGLKAK